MTPLEVDDDITGKIVRAMSEPISDPEKEIVSLRAHMVALAVRTRRIEQIAARVALTIALSSAGVVGSVVGAAYAVGADRARDREQIEELIRRIDRLDGRADASARERNVP